MLKGIKKMVLVMLELIIVGGVIYYIAEKKGIKTFQQIVPTSVQQAVNEIAEKPFPELSNPVDVNFTWKYKGVEYKISRILYESVYEYYQSQPKTYTYIGTPADNWEEEYYGMFLKSNESDSSIADLASDISGQGKKHKLNDNQIVELIMVFVQTIPYDDAKARQILAKDESAKIEYPYETLFSNSGVCSDKSFLAASLLRSLGYGIAIFTYENENHMAIGIQCPEQYSTYGSGYCYAETTALGNKIGIIPNLDASNNVAKAELQFEDFQNNTKKLQDVKIFQASVGREYSGIISTISTQQEMISLKKEIDSLSISLKNQKEDINRDSKKLESMKDDVQSLNFKDDAEEYNNLAEKFNKFLQTYQKEVSKFNNDVILYNKKVARYNSLLQE